MEWATSVEGTSATFHYLRSKRLLGRCEPDFFDLAEFHTLPGLPEIMVGLNIDVQRGASASATTRY